MVFGFGSQGRAQALNLSDSKINVSVCLRPNSPKISAAREAGFNVYTDGAEAAGKATIAALMLPDGEQPSYYNDIISPNLPKNSALLFAHGFNVHYKRIVPRTDLDVILVAPLAHGDAVRKDFLEHCSVPCVIAVAQNATGHAHERAMSYAEGIGGKGPFINSTFAEEVETDLFAEQAVLCGGMPELARAAFDTLVAAGYNEDIAYFCCLRELRAIVELLSKHGIAGMRKRISDTAAYGAATRGPKIIGAAVRKELKQMIDDIRTGLFARELIEDQGQGFKTLRDALERDANHKIEKIHKKLEK